MSREHESSSLRRPIVGVIVGTNVVITSGVKELAVANEQAKTTLYFFSTKDVDFDREIIRGTYYDDSDERWHRRDFPFPDVVYVRGGSGSSVTRVIRRFDELGIKRINPIIAFNKSELFHKLKEDSSVRDYLPYTVDLERSSELSRIFKKRRSVYIKACRGRRGTKVMRVVKLANGGFEYSYSIITKLVRNRVKNLAGLQRAIKSFFGERPVIVQQAIDLLTVSQTRRVDCRAELQRNKYGEIEIVAIPIRVGQSRSPITTHAAAYRFDEYLKRLFPKYSKQKLRELEDEVYDFLKSVYRGVEKVYGKFGEIGIDFGIDKKGRIWLIECNAQSAKVSIRKSYSAETVRKIYKNPLEYAKTLVRVSDEHRSRMVNRSRMADRSSYWNRSHYAGRSSRSARSHASRSRSKSR